MIMNGGSVRSILLAASALILSGCSKLGLCTEDIVDTIKSPTGHYQIEIVSKDCMGSSAVQEVTLRRSSGFMNMATAVAVFDDSNTDKPIRLSAGWRGEHRIVISAHGAKVWSFQPYWHGVRIMEQ